MPTLKKALGQHHLVDPRLCRPLVDFLAPQGRPVVEIGPGGGVLTRALLDEGAHVLAWELDFAWAVELRRRLPEAGLAVVVGDALALPWKALPPGTLVAGNLPYQISTALIRLLLEDGEGISRAAFLVQKEVAERLTAGPGSKAYGALSVLVAARARVQLLGRVRPGSFRPPPKVESAFVGLLPQAPPLPTAAMASFTALVFLAFGQRRKTLRNALAAGWGREKAQAVLQASGLPPAVRAEALDLAAFVELFRVAERLSGES
jgi:16S rRNA (adenine1518-N6/adenine1519-N6)-dimethyltransferase